MGVLYTTVLFRKNKVCAHEIYIQFQIHLNRQISLTNFL